MSAVDFKDRVAIVTGADGICDLYEGCLATYAR